MLLPPDTELGVFQIVRLLGAGGMGEVYLARDRVLNRDVAVKVLRDDGWSPHQHARFEREARASSTLSHPNICHIYQLGEMPDGRRYLVMEYVDGEPLEQRWIQPLTVGEALDVSIQIASALTAAHAAGVVHRDIKPANVIVRRDRLVKVLDFGLAKLVPPVLASPPRGPTQSMAARPSLDRSSAPRITCLRNRRAARTWTRERTSGRSAWCSTRWSPKRSPFSGDTRALMCWSPCCKASRRR